MNAARKTRRELAGKVLHRRWRTVLAFAGTTESAWARDRRPRPCTSSHLRQVVLGQVTNERLLKEVVAWVESQEQLLYQALQQTLAA